MTSRGDSFVPPVEQIRQAFEGAAADELTFVARHCLELGAWDHALALCEALGPSESPGLRLCEAIARFAGGERERGRALVEELLLARPEHLPARAVRAQMLARAGDVHGACAELIELTQRYPDYPGAQGMLATLLMPGPHYREVLAKIHERLRPKSYLEIGVDTGATLALARFSEMVVGIDPAEHPRAPSLPRGTQLFREESDVFFATHPRQSVLGSRRLDLAFIDGMHRFENVLADFAHVEQWTHAGGTILLHDCVPISERAAARERSSKFWVGDTWKVVPALARYRPDLRIRTILTPPSGLVVIRRLNPGSTLLLDRFQDVIDSQRDARWSHQPGSYPTTLGVVPNDDQGLREALG
ncbi:MAG TPA: class I SAM-dependent methyltransferase [Polyangiaceae bacterium]